MVNEKQSVTVCCNLLISLPFILYSGFCWWEKFAFQRAHFHSKAFNSKISHIHISMCKCICKNNVYFLRGLSIPWTFSLQNMILVLESPNKGRLSWFWNFWKLNQWIRIYTTAVYFTQSILLLFFRKHSFHRTLSAFLQIRQKFWNLRHWKKISKSIKSSSSKFCSANGQTKKITFFFFFWSGVLKITEVLYLNINSWPKWQDEV